MKRHTVLIFVAVVAVGVIALLVAGLIKWDHEGTGTIAEPESIAALVNKAESLSSKYVPPDLTECNVRAVKEIVKEARMLRKEAAHALEAMFEAAEKEGMTLYIESGYRSYEHQTRTYNSVKKARGEEYADKYVAKPGHSEHQTGLAMDITNIDHMDDDHEKQLGTMPEGIWLRDNAHRFGFILRYPEDKVDTTGYNYEPWHFRYVGVNLATALNEAGLTLDEYEMD